MSQSSRCSCGKTLRGFLGWFAGDIWFPSSETHANTLIRPPGDSARVVMVSGSVSQLLDLDEIEPHTHTHPHTHTTCITCIKATIRGLTSLQRAGRSFPEVSCVRLLLRLSSPSESRPHSAGVKYSVTHECPFSKKLTDQRLKQNRCSQTIWP